MLIWKEELTSHMEFRLLSYSAEASELGIRPGEQWPMEVQVPGLGNGHKFIARRDIVTPSGDFGGRVFTQSLGCLTLTIFND